MSQCIYCGSSKNLNTSLTITLDNGSKHTVDICDEHAEDASVKTAKAAFLEKQDKIKQLLEQAKALGLNVSETSGGLLIAETTTPESTSRWGGIERSPDADLIPEAVEQQVPKPQPAIEMEDGFVSTEFVDRQRNITSVGGNTISGSVQSYSSYDTSDVRAKLPENALKGKVKMGIVEGREGQPLALPQQRVDGTGTTRINISKAEDDRKLQERFKKMAQSSMQDQAPDFARSGYQNSTATCPICRGDGAVKMGKNMQSCPKCSGSGIISIL